MIDWAGIATIAVPIGAALVACWRDRSQARIARQALARLAGPMPHPALRQEGFLDHLISPLALSEITRQSSATFAPSSSPHTRKPKCRRISAR